MGIQLSGAAPVLSGGAVKAAPAATKADFVEKAGSPKQTRLAPRRMAKKASNPASTGVKMLFFGPWGSGKNYGLVALLLMGYKVFVVTTDVAGDGNLSVKLALRQAGRADLLDNLIVLEIQSHEELRDFCANPASFGIEGFRDIYEFDPDFLVWDGFSNWQQTMLSAWIGDQAQQRAQAGRKDVIEARSSGLQFEQADWGVVRNATLERIDRFCRINNARTGRVWHKIVLAHEGYKSKGQDSGGGFQETKQPLIQGSAQMLSGGAFDLIIRCVVKTGKDGDEAGKRIYQYVTEGSQTSASKKRGFILDPVMDADMRVLWSSISQQAGLTGTETVPLEERPENVADATSPETGSEE